jgi:hypothetical protein
VKGGVRRHLGDAQGGVVDEMLAAPLPQPVDDEPARSGDAGGVRDELDSQLRVGPSWHGRHGGIVPDLYAAPIESIREDAETRARRKLAPDMRPSPASAPSLGGG